MNDESLIKEIIEEYVDEVIGHPIERKDIPVNSYSDVHNDLGDDKPVYHDPQRQRSQ